MERKLHSGEAMATNVHQVWGMTVGLLVNIHVLLPLNDLKLLIYQRYSQFKMRDELYICLVFRTVHM